MSHFTVFLFQDERLAYGQSGAVLPQQRLSFSISHRAMVFRVADQHQSPQRTARSFQEKNISYRNFLEWQLLCFMKARFNGLPTVQYERDIGFAQDAKMAPDVHVKAQT